MNSRAFLFLGLLVAIPPSAHTQSEKSSAADIDLVAATLYGNPLFHLSLDQLTDLLGRPASIRPPNTPLSGEKKIGTMLAYFDKGLLFGCEHPDVDARQTVKAVQVYLARTRPTAGTPFAAFGGKLSFGLTAEWKAPRVMEAFAEFKPKDMYDAEKAKHWKEMEATTKQLEQLTRDAGGKVRERPPEDDNPLTRILVVAPSDTIQFAYEENTKFIEWLLVTR
jgi:hypothetical protein